MHVNKWLHNKRYGLIDLGTNTFHLLIASVDDGKINVVYRRRDYTFLGKGGVAEISKDSFDKGIQSITGFAKTLTDYEVSKIRIIGTSALRNASNGQIFIDTIVKETGLKIEVISGIAEASLIYQGVKKTIPGDLEQNLILDIGGGSVELILFDASGILWCQSFKIGISVLQHQFQRSDPLSIKEKQQIWNHFDDILTPFIAAVQTRNISNLIGASGSFEVLEQVFGLEKDYGLCSRFSLAKFKEFYDQVMPLNLDQRKQVKGIPDERQNLMQLALYLMHYILQKSDAQQILIAPYAMKEGAIFEMADRE